MDEMAVRKAMDTLRLGWLSRNSDYCRDCAGVGIVTSRENQAPLGSGLNWAETSVEPCEECVGGGKCPTCGNPLLTDPAGQPIEGFKGDGRISCIVGHVSIDGWAFAGCPPTYEELY